MNQSSTSFSLNVSLKSEWCTSAVVLKRQHFRKRIQLLLYTRLRVYNMHWNIVNNNDFNDRTNSFLYKKNISLTLYSRMCWCWLCVRGELETGTYCYILTQSSSDHSSTSSSWLGLLIRGSLTAVSPQSASWFSRWHLVPNWLQLQLELTKAVCGTWLYNCLMGTFFRCS